MVVDMETEVLMSTEAGAAAAEKSGTMLACVLLYNCVAGQSSPAAGPDASIATILASLWLPRILIYTTLDQALLPVLNLRGSVTHLAYILHFCFVFSLETQQKQYVLLPATQAAELPL